MGNLPARRPGPTLSADTEKAEKREMVYAGLFSDLDTLSIPDRGKYLSKIARDHHSSFDFAEFVRGLLTAEDHGVGSMEKLATRQIACQLVVAAADSTLLLYILDNIDSISLLSHAAIHAGKIVKDPELLRVRLLRSSAGVRSLLLKSVVKYRREDVAELVVDDLFDLFGPFDMWAVLPACKEATIRKWLLDAGHVPRRGLLAHTAMSKIASRFPLIAIEAARVALGHPVHDVPSCVAWRILTPALCRAAMRAPADLLLMLESACRPADISPAVLLSAARAPPPSAARVLDLLLRATPCRTRPIDGLHGVIKCLCGRLPSADLSRLVGAVAPR